MDWLVHMTDDGGIRDSLPASEFFQLNAKEQLMGDIGVGLAEPDSLQLEKKDSTDGIIKDEEDELSQVNFGVFVSFF